ncbi:MAG: hypothetical protein EOO04_35935, partial [Chitinophagaceae bacterium]
MKLKHCLAKPGYGIFLFFIFFLFTGTLLKAQSVKIITGQVNDSKGFPISGVNILVKGGINGTVTDAAGKFSINTSDTSTLIFSFVGSTPKEVSI